MHGATGSRGSNPLACGQCFVFVFSGLHRFELCGSMISLEAGAHRFKSCGFSGCFVMGFCLERKL